MRQKKLNNKNKKMFNFIINDYNYFDDVIK